MGKQARKEGQAHRREARAFFNKNQRLFNDKIAEKLTIFNEIVKPKPNLCPKWLWRWGSRIFLDTVKLQNFIKGNSAQAQASALSAEEKAGVEIFKILKGKAPTTEDNELFAEDFENFIAKYDIENSPYPALVEVAKTLLERELSTFKQ